MSARDGKPGATGKLAVRLAFVCAITAAVTGLATVAFLAQTFSAGISANKAHVLTRGWIVGGILAILAAFVVALVAYARGAALSHRLIELGLGLAKLGRGAEDVRIRYSGNDEVTRLGRAMQYLANDLGAIAAEAQRGGAGAANADPLVREMRDRALPQQLPAVEGFEVDAVLAAGTRGGLEYFAGVVRDGVATVLVVSNEGVGTVSAIAARLARDELVRALETGANARKALAHTNRVMHDRLPKGVCAKACLLALGKDETKVYHAGYRPPLLVCRAGRLTELHGEGLALGLDDGAVFEKSLRSVVVPMAAGVRLVVANEAAHRLDELVQLVGQHALKHTAAFVNLVVGALEAGAGDGGLREDVILATAKRW